MTVRPILMTVSAVAVVLLLLMITSRAIDGQKQHRLRRQTTGGRPLGGIVADNDAAAADDDTNSGGRVISAAPIGLVSGQPPQQIGQIEFDVEVEEEQLKDGQQAPRVDIVGSRKGSENLDKTGGNRVITGIPVEMASERTKLGDIELDMDITDKSKSYRKSKRPELVVHPKAEKTTGSGVDGGSDGLQTSTAADDELDSLLKLAANNIDNNGDDANGAADNESDSDVKLAAHMPDNDAKGQPLSSSSVTKPRFRDLITPNLFTFTSDDVINTTTSGYGGGDQSANTDAPPVIDTTIGSTKSGAAAAAITLVTTTTTLPLIGRLLAIVWPIVMLLSALFSYI
ncbi:uncharacterized protein LOC128962648 isoform X2 [Oppia nitens]|uniref:uncharacterized protein LOC128962648 isoform X2 n=1 Tax=Oppia nitens TaxID=1686743 RepID=UPI0023DB81F1|nr:uncharacterized protein LOC128962648 isoform X2 [Oppia nitens]